MAGRKTIFLAAAVAVAILMGGIAVYFTSQQQAAVAQISSNTTNPVNNSNISSNTTNPVNNSSITQTQQHFQQIRYNIT